MSYQRTNNHHHGTELKKKGVFGLAVLCFALILAIHPLFSRSYIFMGKN